MKRKSLLTGALLFVLSLPLHAQDYESAAGLRLRLDTAGARGTAMGGTSEAADDPLSVIRNPAILARLRERTIAVDAHQNDSSTDVITSGTIGAFTSVRHDAKTSRSGSAILILPTRSATWAIFVDEPLRAATGTPLPRPEGFGDIVMGVANGFLISPDECNRLNGVIPESCTMIGLWSPAAFQFNSVRVSLRRIGTAVAVQRGALSLGASAHYAELDETVQTLPFTITTDRDRQVTWNAGLQWQVRPRLRVGASYESGAHFKGTEVVRDAFGPHDQPTRFNTPTSYGAGLALEVTPNLTLAADAVHVLYSSLIAPGPDYGYREVMPDVTELHAGAEYRTGTRIPVALRAGWWRDPSHRVRLVDVPGPFPTLFPAAAYNLQYLDEDEDHVTAGIGFGRKIHLDGAVDRSKHTTRGSLTVATKF
jgi:hypothetical protein